MTDKVINQQNEHCHYHYLPDSNIHHVVYQTIGRKAVDVFFVHFEKMLKDTPSDSTIRLIVDNNVKDEPQPLSYMISRLRTIIRQYPKRAAVRVAIVYYKRNPLFAFIDMLFRSMRRGNDRLRYFHHDKWDAMMNWLQANG